MKKLTLLMVLVLIISCTESKEKQLVSNYEQRIGNTKTDLSLKFQKFEFVKDYIAKDSLEYLTKYFNEKKEDRIKYLKDMIEYFEKKLESDKLKFEKAKYKEVKEIYQVAINRDITETKNYRDNLILYNGNCKGTPLESTYNKINIFESKPDSILAKEYNVTYTILNPLLNNVKQTLSKTYFINSDITKILKAVTKEL